MFDVSQSVAIQLGGSAKGRVSPQIPSVAYKLDLKTPSNLIVHLDGLKADADLFLKDSKGQLVNLGGMEVTQSTNFGSSSEHIDVANTTFPGALENPVLQTGTYTIEVTLKQGSNETPFNLVVSSKDSSDAMDAGVLGDLAVYKGSLSAGQSKDYSFTVSKEEEFSFFLATADESPMEFHLEGEGKTFKSAELEEGSPVQAYSFTEKLAVGKYVLHVGSKGKDVRYVVAARSTSLNPMGM
jgi:hypothetical protein